MPRPIILDCDPGHDDAVALLLAAGDPEADLLGVTTVAGNAGLERVTLNARRVATAAGLDALPIHAGCDRPLLGTAVTAPDIHGPSGLDGVDWPEPTVELAPGHAVPYLVETVGARPGEVTLVAVGPLTNLALATRLAPGFVEQVREVVIMGGSADRGNVTPAAEFNVYADPEAAAIVFGEAWPVTLVGLDLTHQALASKAVRERIRGVGTPLATTVVDLLGFFSERYRARQGFAAPPVHDPCAVMRVIAPELVATERATIRVETGGGPARGMTVVGYDPGGPHQAATRLDADGFWDRVVRALERLG